MTGKTEGTDTSTAIAQSGEEALDFTGDQTASDEKLKSITVSDKEYDPRPQEDTARRIIAYLLIGLLWFIIVAIVVLLLAKTLKITDLKEFAVILGPVVTLVSAATGFYYGTKTNNA